MSEEQTTAEPEVGTALAKAESLDTAQGAKTLAPTGISSAKLVDGVIELSMPNLLPTDNVEEVVEVRLKRVKMAVRIDTLIVKAVDNGYTVKIPNAGRQSMFGPDGSRHVFLDKGAMLEFVATVIGQVSYQYRETEADREETADGPEKVQADSGG